MGSFVHINDTITENGINEGALRILKRIRPEWPEEKVEFKLFTDGITNKLVACFLNDGDERDTVLVRIYGNKTDMLIDRNAEKRNIILLNKFELAPRLYVSFQNGLAYEYVPGRTLNEETVIQPEIYKLVARRMARMHKVNSVQISETKTVLWDKMQAFLELVPDRFSDCDKQKRYEELIIPKTEIQKEVNLLKEKLSNLDSPIVFAHNDLLLGNIIYTKETNTVTFIDFEYAAPNYQAFDIGNHFAEFVGLKEVDYSKYPKKQLQVDWLRTYLEEYHSNGAVIEVTDSDVQKLYVETNQFVLAAHVFWGIWSLIQAEHSYIDFDFIEYAAIRFNEYFARKEEFLAMTEQNSR